MNFTLLTKLCHSRRQGRRDCNGRTARNRDFRALRRCRVRGSCRHYCHRRRSRDDGSRGANGGGSSGGCCDRRAGRIRRWRSRTDGRSRLLDRCDDLAEGLELVVLLLQPLRFHELQVLCSGRPLLPGVVVHEITAVLEEEQLGHVVVVLVADGAHPLELVLYYAAPIAHHVARLDGGGPLAALRKPFFLRGRRLHGCLRRRCDKHVGNRGANELGRRRQHEFWILTAG